MEDFFIQFKILTNFNFNSNKIKGEKIYGKNNRKSFSILKEELVPAEGCTEPIAIAYAAAKLTNILGNVPEK